MDRTLRSILWVLVLLVILSTLSAGWFFAAKERLSDEYVKLEIFFKSTVAKLNEDISVSKKENSELTLRLNAVEKELAALEDKNKILLSQREELSRGKNDLEKEIARVKKGKSFIEKKLKDMESDRFVAGLLKEKASLEVELARVKESPVVKAMEIEKLKRENMDLDVMLSKVMEEKKAMEDKLTDSSKVAEILSKDLFAAGQFKEINQAETEKMRAENSFLKNKVSELESVSVRFDRLLAEKQNVLMKVTGLQRELESKNSELEQLKFSIARRGNEELKAEAYHSPGEVDLPPIVLQRQDSYSGQSGLSKGRRISGIHDVRGRIVTVNRDHGFVVMDLGSQDGIRVGDKFDVYRDDLSIGSIKVIQVRDRISACDVMDLKTGYGIEVDDTIVK
jgi:hypothetical protein